MFWSHASCLHRRRDPVSRGTYLDEHTNIAVWICLSQKKPKSSSQTELTIERLRAHDDAMEVVEDRTTPAPGSGTPLAAGSATPTTPGSGTPSVVGSEAHSEVESERSARQVSLAEHLDRLHEKIVEMMDFTMPRNNVHKPIKEGLTKALLILQSCYTTLDEKQKTLKTAQKTTSKISNIPPPSTKRSKKGGERDAPKDAELENGGTANWQQVKRKRRGKKETPAKAKAPDQKAKVKSAGRPRPGVVVVKAKDPKSYAEILKLLSSEATLKDSEREMLHHLFGGPLEPETLVGFMLEAESNWLAVSTFAQSVMTRLRSEERARRR
uniref:Uncharacterized protein n=1 Tax=Trichogramma kaykai TaxID=54128 RepID=A0ABD2X981_9HYME